MQSTFVVGGTQLHASLPVYANNAGQPLTSAQFLPDAEHSTEGRRAEGTKTHPLLTCVLANEFEKLVPRFDHAQAPECRAILMGCLLHGMTLHVCSTDAPFLVTRSCRIRQLRRPATRQRRQSRRRARQPTPQRRRLARRRTRPPTRTSKASRRRRRPPAQLRCGLRPSRSACKAPNMHAPCWSAVAAEDLMRAACPRMRYTACIFRSSQSYVVVSCNLMVCLPCSTAGEGGSGG